MYSHGERHAFHFSEDYVREHQGGQDVQVVDEEEMIEI
jgi:tRNA 2-thiocytidine biosynthesis protein TtcA